jgi:hypothetical protein
MFFKLVAADAPSSKLRFPLHVRETPERLLGVGKVHPLGTILANSHSTTLEKERHARPDEYSEAEKNVGGGVSVSGSIRAPEAAST